MTTLQTALLVLLAPLGVRGPDHALPRPAGTAAAAVSVAAAAVVRLGALFARLRGRPPSRGLVGVAALRLASRSRIGVQVRRPGGADALDRRGRGPLRARLFARLHARRPGRARYFGGLSIFMFSMIGIVLADNLFMMFIFWELVGFSSYLLINHWHEQRVGLRRREEGVHRQPGGRLRLPPRDHPVLLGERHRQPHRRSGDLARRTPSTAG